MKNIVCFGEVLWDVFPTHKKIGGAPLNVALRLKSFENNVSIVTKIGNDALGKEIFNFIKEQGVLVNNIQKDFELKTSEVIVTLDKKGSATYIIKYPIAWDNIELTEAAKVATIASDAFIYGSLSARDSNSKTTLLALLEIAPFKIFDVNLRAPHYTQSLLKELMQYADFIKFNDDELFEINSNLGFESNDIELNIRFIAKQTQTSDICVTLGSKGAVLYINDNFYYNKGYQVKVVDTVGAGDSFLASLIDKLLKRYSPQYAIDFACAIGALVTSCEGANPKINQKQIEDFINAKIK
jgi:fructokinase